MATWTTFFTALFGRHPGRVDLRGIHPAGGVPKVRLCESLTEVLETVEAFEREGRNSYYGICTRGTLEGGGRVTNLLVAPTVMQDLDDLDPADPEADLAARLGELPAGLQQPSVKVETLPARMQIGWSFTEPIDVSTPEGVLRYEAINPQPVRPSPSISSTKWSSPGVDMAPRHGPRLSSLCRGDSSSMGP